MMTLELTCPSKLHGLVVAAGIVEIKCNSRFCGSAPGVVVLHRWNVETGELVTTEYRQPQLHRRPTTTPEETP